MPKHAPNPNPTPECISLPAGLAEATALQAKVAPGSGVRRVEHRITPDAKVMPNTHTQNPDPTLECISLPIALANGNAKKTHGKQKKSVENQRKPMENKGKLKKMKGNQ